MSKLAKVLKSMIDGMEKKVPVDVIVTGKDVDGMQVLSALKEFGRDQDFHVISDHEISHKRIFVTSHAMLGQFAGAGRN